MKQWTIETLVAQLRSRIKEEYDGVDILEEDAPVLAKPLGEVLSRLQNAAFRARMVQIPGQTTIDDELAVLDEEG